MAHETSKQAVRRGADRRYATRWLKGGGIDIGCGSDSLGKLAAFFPLMETVRPWDLPDGDAMLMEGVADGSFDFVHSSHCLEHLVDPVVALGNWIRICREGGHLIVTIPDEDLYEQGIWPSTFNADHKWTFTIAKSSSWSPKSVNVLQLLGLFQEQVDIIKIELLDSGFEYGHRRHDQSMGMLSESAIEFVLRKKTRIQADIIADLFAQAVSHQQAARTVEAAALYRDILARDPDHVSSLNNLAMISEADEAEGFLRKAIGLNPAYRDAHTNLAAMLVSRGRLEEAEPILAQVLSMKPDCAIALGHVAAIHEAQGRFEAAFAAREKLIAGGGASADDFYRLGRLSQDCARTDGAIAYFDRAIAIDPDHVQAHVYRGHCFWMKGDYRRAAQGLAYVWKSSGLDLSPFVFADESGVGRDLTGQTIALSADSGLGDTLQFIRYAPLLKAQGATVIVECQPPLLRLVGAMPSVDRVVPLGELDRGFDRRLPLHGLLGAFGTTNETIPGVPYLTAPARAVAAWRKKLKAYSGLKVGLVWAGNPTHPADGRRSIDPASLKPLGEIPGLQFVSLQKDRPSRDTHLDILDWTDKLLDMADTAALVEALDLVVTVDSAVAHLAGALGRPTWVLNRFDNCCRWLENRSDSPWYPTLRLFRQPRPGDWESVIAEVSFALMHEDLRASARSGRPRTGAVFPHVAAAE